MYTWTECVSYTTSLLQAMAQQWPYQGLLWPSLLPWAMCNQTEVISLWRGCIHLLTSHIERSTSRPLHPYSSINDMYSDRSSTNAPNKTFRLRFAGVASSTPGYRFRLKCKQKAAATNTNDGMWQKGDRLEADVGVPPRVIVGKVLTGVRRSHMHPNLGLHFEDGSAFQVRVNTYDPLYPGMEKEIFMDHALEEIFGDTDCDGSLRMKYTISHATFLTLKDQALYVRSSTGEEFQWQKSHTVLAFRFEE
jgi:hypothetical protein